MTTICLINQKGGCGKSSTCFHLAGWFAQQGKSILLIDADPQGSLSQGFFGSHEVEKLSAGETLAAAFQAASCSNPGQIVRRTGFERISIIPANHSLARFNTPEPETLGTGQFAIDTLVRRAGRYDIALIDCPPNLYACSWNALIASDSVLVPVPPEDFGTQGLRAVHQAIDQTLALSRRLKLLGHVVTRFDGRLLVHRAYDQKLRSVYGESVLESRIPEASAFKVALTCRQPVSLHNPRCKATRATAALGREIATRIGLSPLGQKVA